MTAVSACPLRHQVDPRALRFSAAATAAVLAMVLLLASSTRPVAVGLLGSQVAVYGFTAFVSVHWSVWARLFAGIVWPRLGPAADLVEAGPVRRAQGVGFVLTAAALAAFLRGADTAAYSLTAVTLAGAILEAATGWRVGSPFRPASRRVS
ncbi:DUF4395 family protein [Nocardioides stalactiti]|uniref:DUF4395 family protein n=1 Tax=Nocardioides stalactiti TaxID=2755356 RepID=UPI001602BA77|nr:DUF4395 family protein [Nocardioides stalactiti]